MSILRKIWAFLREKEVIFFQLFVIAFSAYCICRSDALQKMISPRGYWENKVLELTTQIEGEKQKLAILKIHLKKIQAKAPFKIKEAEQKALITGGEVAKMVSSTKIDYQNKIKKLRYDIEELMKVTQEEEKALQEAQHNLHMCEKKNYCFSKNTFSKV